MIETPKLAVNHPTTMTNVAVLATLMALLAVTIAVSMIDVDRFLPGHGWAMPLAMGIAAAKTTLIVAYFMHVRYADRLTRVFVAAGAVWLTVLFVLVMVEAFTR